MKKRKPGRPKGSKNRVVRVVKKMTRDLAYALEEIEVGRERLRLASAAYSAPKTMVALASIRLQAKHVIKVLEPLFGSD